MTTKEKQITRAAELGRQAFEENRHRIPYWDKELNLMLTGRQVGETPPGAASTVQIYRAWLAAWDRANLARAKS